MHHHSQKKGVNVKSIWFQILGTGPSSSVSNTFPCKHLDLLHVLYKEEEHCMTTAGKWALCRLGIHYEAWGLSSKSLTFKSPFTHLPVCDPWQVTKPQIFLIYKMKIWVSLMQLFISILNIRCKMSHRYKHSVNHSCFSFLLYSIV